VSRLSLVWAQSREQNLPHPRAILAGRAWKVAPQVAQEQIAIAVPVQKSEPPKGYPDGRSSPVKTAPHFGQADGSFSSGSLDKVCQHAPQFALPLPMSVTM
jgi:hypothetical protein